MKKITREAYEHFLQELGVERGDNVLVHSSLGHLGVVEGHGVRDIPEVLYRWLQDFIGDKGGVFMPNYAYSFPRERRADLREQASTVGIWTEWFRQQDFTQVSGHPMFSITGAGGTALEVCRPDEAEFSPFSENSTFARLHDSDALMLFMGVNLSYATFMVYCEQKLGKPYRFLKPFHGECTLQNGETITGDYYHYCYPMDGGYSADFMEFQDRLVESGAIEFLPLGMGKAFGIRMKRFLEEVDAYTAQNKWGLLTRDPEFYCRFEDGQEVRYPVD